MHTPTLRLTLSAVVLALGLAACGKKETQAPATQVAAKVGTEEISVHQINQVLQRSAPTTPENARAMSRAVLEKLIDQQLAVDQATDAKLHRSPDVVAQIEAAKREILARAYLQKVSAALPKPTPQEVKTYYSANPALFAERRIYNLQEVVVPKTTGGADITSQLRTLAAQSKSADEVAAVLKAQAIPFSGGSATRAAEQVPLELLARLHTVKDGQSLVFEAPQAATYVRVLSSQLAPVPEAAALPRIEQFLLNQRATEAIGAEFKRLRAASSITYMGEFAKPDAATATQQPDKPAPSPLQAAQSALEKGVAGLK